MHAHDLNHRIIELLKQSNKNFFEIGQTFKKIKEDKLWQYMGEGGFDTWSMYLAQPEICYGKSTVDNYIRIYAVYVEDLKIDMDLLIAVPVSKLQQMMPVVKNMDPDVAVEKIEFLNSLGGNDFTAELNKLKGLPENSEEESKQLAGGEEHDLKEIMKNMYNELVGMESSDDVQTVVNRYEGVILQWHKNHK